MQVFTGPYLNFLPTCSSTAHKTLPFHQISFGDISWFGKKISRVALYTGKYQCLLSIKEHNFRDHILKGADAHSSLAVPYFLFLICWGFDRSSESEFFICMDWMTKEISMFLTLPKTC